MRDAWSGLAATVARSDAGAADILVSALRTFARRPVVVPLCPWTARRPPPGRHERTSGPGLLLFLAGDTVLHHGGGAVTGVPGTAAVFTQGCAYGEWTPHRRTASILIVARGDGIYAHVAERRPGTTPEIRVRAWSSPGGAAALTAGIHFALASDAPAVPDGHLRAAMAAVSRLLAAAVERAPVPTVPATGKPLVRQVQAIIAQRARDPALSVRAIATAVRMHPSSLGRVVKARTGSSVFALLQRHRLEHAERLLADPRMKISEIARLSGFGTVRRLRIAWGRHHQTPPTVVRAHAHRQLPAGADAAPAGRVRS